MSTIITALSPVAGAIVPLAETSDPIFAGGALGPGIAVQPADGTIVAPVPGTLRTVLPHAYGIATDDGVEILVHVGIDTVELEGRHFEPAVAVGDRVTAGQLLARADFEAIAGEGFDTVTILVVTNADPGGTVAPCADGSVARGAAVLRLEGASGGAVPR
ncbi:PTS sugar transporter subunit IIA [Demequina zhanjiangensis]|uniref:PTS glucose transporter subunit IIA n=1 Tax=Demequina zhanjiangensis TaxID=3051659 RepID=A0ABT8FXZ6_9MICO|nr:PTS glucose transporter subunit IIA [Demequina sp. SYSU T00b26]MDN4471775.1 PTS glucose transporter subunit IIA [Demequina sp. SYSU T00b26]